MAERKQLTVIVLCVTVLAGAAAFIGMVLHCGDGSFIYQSI